MTVKPSGFTPTLPIDVIQIIGFIHDFTMNQKNEPEHQEGEIFDLSEKFVTDIENLLIKNNIPLDWDETLPEPCREEVIQLTWKNINDVVQSTLRQRFYKLPPIKVDGVLLTPEEWMDKLILDTPEVSLTGYGKEEN